MTFDFVNIITFVSILLATIALLSTFRQAKREKNSKENESMKVDSDEYAEILRSTHWLETEREKNSGEHFSDETVYLRRANVMRKTTAFFDWVRR